MEHYSQIQQLCASESEYLLVKIQVPLLEWYDQNRRKLPWREDPTPYHVWVSEIMLQQTRVEAVKPYYARFMEAYPEIRDLADTQEERLLKYWEGLGYYNRARNLKAAAIQIMEQYAGSMPSEYEQIRSLKGIGSYTAGAIASIAFGKAVPAVDGNVLRVLSRIRKDGRMITDSKVKTQVEEELGRAMPVKRPGDFNQALMEIGACVCLPNGVPKCESCPLQDICLAHREHCEMDYPVKAEKKKRNVEKKTVLIIRDREKVVVTKRPDGGLLAGMYEFPCLEGYCSRKQVLTFLIENGFSPLHIQQTEETKHIFTHKEWHMRGFLIRMDELAEGNNTRQPDGWIYASRETIREQYPVPAAYEAFMRLIGVELGITTENGRRKEK